jgi:hypothetical protein
MNEKLVEIPVVPSEKGGDGSSSGSVVTVEIQPVGPVVSVPTFEFTLPDHHVEPDSPWKRPHEHMEEKILHVDPDDPWKRIRRPGDDSEMA